MNIIRYVYLAATAVVCTTVAAQKTIIQEDCWFDGNYTSIQATQPVIDIGMMQPGIHSYTMRVKDSEGLWSSPVTRYFLIPTATADATEISHREYWLDGKFSERTSFGESPAMLDISHLDVGIHSLTMRVKNNADIWSNPLTRYFIMPTATMKANEIVQREYWLDGKIAERRHLGTSTAVIDLGELSEGMHSFSMRVMDDAGVWSNPLTRYFIITNEAESASIVNYAYWIDDDVNNIAYGPLTQNSGVIMLDISDVEAGQHTLSWMVGDSNGRWSKAVTQPFISISCYTYTVPTSGVGTFSASTIVAVPNELTTHYTTIYCPEFIDGPSMQIEDVGSQYIPANTGILLRGEPGTTHIIRYSEETPATITDNSLVAVVEPTHISQTNGEFTNFVLKDGEFHKVSEQTEEHKVPANRAYLPISLLSGAPQRVSIIWNDAATAVEQLKNNGQLTDGIVYDIQGRPVADISITPLNQMNLQKGIYIINGKKIFVK